MRNLKGLEQRILQDSKPELLDVKPKNSEGATSPGSHSGSFILFFIIEYL